MADEDGCVPVGIAGVGAPWDREAWDVFCFFRDAEAVGLGTGSAMG